MNNTKPERRADSPMIARIDERTLNIVKMLENHAGWQKDHQDKDDITGERVTALEKQNSRQAGAMWVITGLAGFLGIDRIIGMFK